MRQKYRKIDQFSIESYHKFVQTGQKVTVTNQILAILSQSPMTRTEIARYIGCDKCNVCAPMKWLENESLIRKNGKKYDDVTKRWVNLYDLVKEDQNPVLESTIMVKNPQIIENEPYQ